MILICGGLSLTRQQESHGCEDQRVCHGRLPSVGMERKTTTLSGGSTGSSLCPSFLTTQNVEREFDLISNSHEAVHSGRRLHLEVAPIDAEFSLSAKLSSSYRHPGVNSDRPRDT